MNRPRCCEWLPLSTQQLRLRNVIRILGVNIECVEEGSHVYYTLHHTKLDSAIYTSEKLPQRHPQLKWAEITCAEMLKSNSNCVCVKVWAQSDHVHRPHKDCRQSVLTTTETSSRLQSNNDQLLFSWGVYFSGLIVVNQLVDTKCSPNSLIFQINGEYFASPNYLSTDHLREQLSFKYERLSSSVPKSSLPPPDTTSINSPRASRSSSPVEQDLLHMSKARYAQLNCPIKEVRKSYSLQQLLHMQELQRTHLQRLRETLDVASDIQQLCVRCITKEQLGRRRRRTISAHNTQHHSMGRTLSVLLSEQQQINPQELLRAQILQEETETLRARQRLLANERAAYIRRNAELRQHLCTIEQKRDDLTKWLHTRQQEMYDEQGLVEEQRHELAVIQQAKRRLILNMERRMSVLCLEMREIYPFGRDEQDFHTVCGIPFPSVDMYAGDSSQVNSANMEHVTPIELSVSLGYVAHLVQMLTVILNRPLRNPIVHEGSHSRIMDIIKDIHYISREYPLYSRTNHLPKPVKYAIYLLNQNIAQLCFDITGRRSDPRSCIENLAHIFLILEELEQHQRVGGSILNCRVEKSVQRAACSNGNANLIADDHDNNGANINVNVSALDAAVGGLTLDEHNVEILSKSNSSDMNHVLSPPTVLSMTVAADNISALFESLPDGQSHSRLDLKHTQQRSCRSEGSYSDREELDDFNNRYFSNSDSHLNVKRGKSA